MTALYILGGIFLVFFAIAMIRAEVIIKYADDFGLAVRICGIKLTIMPRKPKKVGPRDFTPKKIAKREEKARRKAEKEAQKKKAKKARKDAEKAEKAELKKQGKVKKKPLGETISLILALVKTAVGRFAKHLRVRVARLHINVGTTGIFRRLSFSMPARYSISSGAQKLTAVPSAPARAVRPMRWT